MSYTRDEDYMTRGVGAVATFDRVSPERHRNRVAVARATAQRDRAMAAVAGGALARSRPSGGRDTALSRTRTGTSHGHPAGRMPGTVSGGGHPTMVTPTTMTDSAGCTVTTGFSWIAEAPGAPGHWQRTAAGGQDVPFCPGGMSSPVATTPPTSAPSSGGGSMPISVTVSGGSVSGGGGGGGAGSASRPPTGVSPLPSLPELPEVPDMTATSGGSDNTKRNLLIAGGALAAAYLLFRRKGA